MESYKYFSPVEVRNFHCNKELKCVHLNAQSVVNKTCEMKLFLLELQHKIDVIMITETWCRNDVDYFTHPWYKHYYINRNARRGGGIAILIDKTRKDCDVVDEFSIVNTDFEMLTIINNSIAFVAVYRPPQGDIHVFLNILENLFSYVNDHKYNMILGGDVNIDLLVHSSPKQEFLYILDLYGMQNVIESPTRVTSTSSTLLDVFVTSFPNASITYKGVISAPLSDHMPIILFVKVSGEKFETRESWNRCINQSSLEIFRRRIEDTDWTPVLAENEADQALEKFFSLFLIAYNFAFPKKKTIRKGRQRKPWMTSELLKLVKKRNKMYKQFLKNRNQECLVQFKQFRNFVNKQIRIEKTNYYEALFTSTSQVGAMWKNLNTLLDRKAVSDEIESITLNGKILRGESLANEFNKYLVSQCPRTLHGQNLTASFAIKDSMFLSPTDSNEVKSIFLNLKNSKCVDNDGVQVRPVKYVIDVLTPYITHIYNRCLVSGVFPNRLKVAKVLMIFKGGDKNKLSNYRPISILPVFSKALERIIFVRIHSFFMTHQVITNCQFGFMSGRSTEMALLHAKEIIIRNMEEKLLTLGIFLDFSKAFDSINHDVLIKKLMGYGIRGIALKLITSYLTSREQRVHISDIGISDLSNIVQGVPQGSLLGPLLFNAYINDIVITGPDIRFIIYADDCSIFVNGTNVDSMIERGNTILDQINQWAENNLLKINPAKSKAVIFRAKNRTINATTSLRLQSFSIEFVDRVKFLGVFFHEALSWNIHVDYIVSKLARVTGQIYRFRHILPHSVKLLLYNTLFLSTLSYAYLVWGSTTENNLSKLQILQNRCVRAMRNLPARHSVDDVLKADKIVTVRNLFQFRCLCAYKKALNKNNSSFLSLANLRVESKGYNTRSGITWHKPIKRTGYGDQSLCVALPAALNKYMLRPNVTMPSFKKLKEIILE